MKKSLLLVLSLAAALIGCASHHELPPRQAAMPPMPLGAGASAMDFTVHDIDGNAVSLSTHLGNKVVLLDFCSTWCEPCVAEFPHLRALYQGNKDRGFIILAISVDGPETIANVPGFARRNQLDFPMLVDEDARVSTLYNPKRAAPVTVLIGRDRKIRSVREGYTSGDEEGLTHEVDMALDDSRATR